MKDKSKVLKTYGYMFDKLQFICLIGGGASSPGGDASPRRHCQLGVRCPKLAILELVIFMYLLVKASSLD